MSTKTVNFKLVKETKGALKYQEVNGTGRQLTMAEANIGTLYLRKTMFPDARFPARITVSVSTTEAGVSAVAA